MKTREYTLRTGEIKTFHLEDEIEAMAKTPKSKPSSRPIRTKKGRKAIAGLIDIEKNHNHSWYREICERAKKNPDALALFYRANKISFREMIEKADVIAKSMVEVGVKKGDIIPACLSNTPETVYFLLAANKIGAVLNIFGSNYEEDYINTILDSCSTKLFLSTDDSYAKINHIIKNRPFNKIVVSSLADSLPEHPELCDEYEPKLDKYYRYKSHVEEFKNDDPRISSFNDFYQVGEKSDVEVVDTGTLDDKFLITYTSGSTLLNHPSQIMHSNRSLIVSGRFHDHELSGNPDMKGLRGMAHIHTDSNTDIITCISDNLMQLWSVAMEPEYGKETALDAIFINKPNYLNMTTSHLIAAFKEYLIDKKFHEDGVGRKMPWLFACFAVGEGTSKGEEKFLNLGLRVAHAGSGVKIYGISLPYTTICIGGGDCEHGGIYYTLWKSLYDKINYFKLKSHETGLMPESYVQVSAFVLNDDGTYRECDFGDYGLIAANSSTTMRGYRNDVEKTLSMIITDDTGRDWISSNVYGFIDELGGVHVKCRINNQIEIDGLGLIYPFVLETIICEDTKNILSCTIVQTEVDGVLYPVINIEFQPGKKINVEKVLQSLVLRIRSKINYDVTDDFLFRIMDYKESFPLNASGKRSTKLIQQMGLDRTFKYALNPNLKKKNKELIKKGN